MDARLVASAGRRAVAAGWVGLVAACALTVGCAEVPEGPRAYVERLGTDTMAIELFARRVDPDATPPLDRIEGRVLARSSVTQVAYYAADLAPDGRVTRLMVDLLTPEANPAGPPPVRIVATLEADSATVEKIRGPTADTARLAVPAGTLPTAGRVTLPIGLWEHAVRLAVAAGAEEYPFGVLLTAQGRAAPNAVRRVGGDTVSVDFFGNPMLIRVGAEGNILGISGRATTLKIEVEPTGELTFEDLDRLAAAFAARDARGEGMGVASPQETVEATGGRAAFRIVYSRPARRGREIWGGLVPYGRVWRTGANAATHFTTTADLQIGDAVVPAGTYTLWTTFTPDSATLIFNRQTNISGTAYDASADLARVPLERETLEEPVERFTIVVQPTLEGGILQLSWDRTRFSVPLEAR